MLPDYGLGVQVVGKRVGGIQLRGAGASPLDYLRL